MDGRPPRQRLTDRLEQSEILRSRDDPASGLRVCVDNALQVGKNAGRALRFVENAAVRNL